MNYRHGYHAGNFADVLKHALLVRVLVHLGAKDAAYRVIDTHAGRGRYDLTAEAAKTGEFRQGIERLLADPPAGIAGELLAPYLGAVRAENTGGGLKRYPGSPALIRRLTRPQDRLVFCESNPREFAALAENVAKDRRARASASDGWQALKSLLPPPERRGAVLIDPPFEQPAEFRQIAQGIEDAASRFATGVYMIWYPVKNRHDTDAALRRIVRSAGRSALRFELAVAPPRAEGPLAASGLLVFNPPWKLEEECRILLPALADSLGAVQGSAAWKIENLA
jgi:23S rRNA (adenine2030-N6)-methyltransferase